MHVIGIPLQKWFKEYVVNILTFVLLLTSSLFHMGVDINLYI